jgi:hypothetical protein
MTLVGFKLAKSPELQVEMRKTRIYPQCRDFSTMTVTATPQLRWRSPLGQWARRCDYGLSPMG